MSAPKPKPIPKPRAKPKAKPAAVPGCASLSCNCWNCTEQRTKHRPATRALSLDMGTRSLGLCLVGFSADNIQDLKKRERAELKDLDWIIERWSIVDFGINQARGATDQMVSLFTGCGEHWWASNMPAGVDVVMESQPVNGPSKVLSHCFQIFFALHDQQHGVHGREVYFMAPNNKLKVDPALLAHYDQQYSAKNYDVRKAVVMHIARWVLARNDHNAVWRAYYSKQPYKQRTDLADALAQGIRYLQVKLGLSCENILANLTSIPPDSAGAVWLMAQAAIDLRDWQKKVKNENQTFTRQKRGEYGDESGVSEGSGRKRRKTTVVDLI